MNSKPKKILCMGAINMDITMHMDHLPESGETVQTDNVHFFPGGKSGNQTVAVARHGIKPTYFGNLGNDSFSEMLIDNMKKDDINTDSIRIIPSETSGIALIRIDKYGENSISFYPGANSKLSSKDVKLEKTIFEHNDILLISGELTPETTFQAFRSAKESELIVIWDPAPVPDEIPTEIPCLVDYITPNEIEVFKLTGQPFDIKNPGKSIHKLQELGFINPIITAGKAGAFFEDQDNNLVQILPPIVKTIDTTAAGDCFVGVFASYYAQNNKIEDCISKACEAAAISTTILGAQNSILDQKAIDDLRISKDIKTKRIII